MEKKIPKITVYDPTLVYVMTDYLLNSDTAAAKKLYNTYRNLLGIKTVNSQVYIMGQYIILGGIQTKSTKGI
ncbi:MAG: hypothetical protein WDO71_28315 [Bacteroidota bacterium]